MKKILTFLALLMVAVNSNNALANQKATQEKPTAVLKVLDVSNKVAKDTGNLTYSVSNPNLLLCWAVFNMEFASGKNNDVTEVFIAPSKDIQVLKAGANVRKKDNIVVVNSKSAATNDGKALSECWQFDDSDPLGKYQMDLQINDIVFKNLNFELVK